MSERFEIIQSLAGQGAFGRVDKAKDNYLDRGVAIKTLDPIFKDINEADIERFKREAKILAALSHPNIPAIYDVDFDPENKNFKIIYEWIEGITLNKYLMDVGPLSLEEAKGYFGNICSALTLAHKSNIVHRDIKPSNLIITNNKESCYVVDFGISLTNKDIERLTNGSSIVGTPGYMSPEQEMNQELDGSSDIFSLGIVLYESLCGNRPTIGSYKSLNSINEAIPPSIDQLIQSSITPEKNNRIKTAEEFHSRLIRALRPSSNIGELWSQGALYEVISSLQTLNHSSFGNLPAGQKKLLLIRLTTLFDSTEASLKNPTASFLSAILKICGKIDEKNFELIISNSLTYGFEIQYGDTWHGNPIIRDELSNLALYCERLHYEVFSKRVLEFLTGKNLVDKEPWFLVDMSNILQKLLANEFCDEKNADLLGEELEKVLKVRYKTKES